MTPKVLLVHASAGALGDRIRIEQIVRFLRDSALQVHEVLVPSISRGYIRKEGFSRIAASLAPPRQSRIYDLRNPLLQHLNMTIAENHLLRLKRRLDYDVIIAESVFVGWLASKVFGDTSTPLIVDVHGLAGAEAKGSNNRFWHKKEALEAEVFKNCNYLLVVSNQMKRYLVRHFKISENKISVIYNGAEPQNVKAQYAYPLRVIYAGGFAYWERVDDYLNLAKGANPGDFRFYLAGTGALRKQILSRIRTEGIPVKYLGFMPRLAVLKLMTRMQIGIAPSTRDLARLVAFPIKVLDYMSCGLPVLAPRVGDWGQMVEAEDSGITLTDDSVESYIGALGVLKGKEVWQGKSNNGIRAIRERYSWKRVLSPLYDLIARHTD